MISKKKTIFLFLCFFAEYVVSQNHRRRHCQVLHDCNSCIQNPDCAWCMKPERKKQDQTRCDTREWFNAAGNCSAPFLEDPSNEIKILEDVDLTTSNTSSGSGSGSGSSSSGGGTSSSSKFVQITPQRIRLKLRPGIETRVSFKIAQAKQYPVDLYYLMDLSNSMSDDRKNIVKLGRKLASTIQSITSDFQIGFGSFVDKELMPYISLVPDDNCQQENCPGPYSFQHQMSLSPDAKLFTDRVREAPISGNIDNPEGGFDALLQVMVCENEVGWRSQSRRVIVFTTDQSFHIACDGKLGGVVQPNDGLCHLNSSGFYTYSTKQDYPSVGHINHIAKERSVNIIWAVTEDKFWLYKSLEGIVSGSSAGIISGDSSNVVELVRQQYEAITTTIKVETNASANCNAKITTKCLDRSEYGPPECENIELGTPVEMILSVTLKDCVAETFGVSPVGLNEQMMVEIEPICECPCSSDELLEDDLLCQATECNRHGHLVCGTCQCCGDFFGPNCDCSGTLADKSDPDKTCRQNGTVEGAPVCSGRGKCDCGVCVCDPQREGVLLTGQFCETVCDNTACERDINGNLCSGHGDCLCGFCKCEAPWTGDSCQCKEDQSKCKSPDTPDLICSGNGECPCDRCICTEEGYSGEFCEICVTCKDQCVTLRPCFECVAFNDAHLMLPAHRLDNPGEKDTYDEALSNCSKQCIFDYQEVVPSKIPEDWNRCTFAYKNCEYTFSHSAFRPGRDNPQYIFLNLLEGEEAENLSQEERRLRCPPKPDLIGILLGVIGCIVCVGMVTILLWKAFTTIHDRREFAKFEAERQNIKMPSHSNPIFRQATTTVQNPTFNSPQFY